MIKKNSKVLNYLLPFLTVNQLSSKIKFIMKKQSYLQKIAKTTTILGFSITALVSVSCSNEEIDITEDTSLSSSSESFVTPAEGRTYYIRNRSSRRYMDIEDASNSNGANLAVFNNRKLITNT